MTIHAEKQGFWLTKTLVVRFIDASHANSACMSQTHLSKSGCVRVVRQEGIEDKIPSNLTSKPVEYSPEQSRQQVVNNKQKYYNRRSTWCWH
jgi:hypothetical protein